MTPSAHQMKRLFYREASGALALRVTGVGIAFGVQTFLARLLGVHSYGVYVYVLSWVSALAVVGKLGFDTALVRCVAAYTAKGEWTKLRGVLSRSQWIVFGTSSTLALLMALGATVSAKVLEREVVQTLWVASPLIVLIAVVGLRHGALQGFKRIPKALTPEFLLRPILLGVLGAAIWSWWEVRPPAPVVMAANVLATGSAVIVGTLWVRREAPWPPGERGRTVLTREWLGLAIPLMLVQSMHLVTRQADIMMLGPLVSTTAAGKYAAASRVATLLAFGLAASNAIVSPLIAELHSGGKLRELGQLASTAAKGVTAFTLAGAVAIAVGGKAILGLFGHEFVEAYPAMMILVVGQALNAVVGPVGFLLSLTGHQRKTAWVMAAGASANVLLNSLLIPPFGLLGAACATAVSLIGWNLALLLLVRRVLKINPTLFARSR